MNCQEVESLVITASEKSLSQLEKSGLQAHALTCSACQDLVLVLGMSSPGLGSLDQLALARGNSLNHELLTDQTWDVEGEMGWLEQVRALFDIPAWAPAIAILGVVSFLGLQATKLDSKRANDSSYARVTSSTTISRDEAPLHTPNTLNNRREIHLAMKTESQVAKRGEPVVKKGLGNKNLKPANVGNSSDTVAHTTSDSKTKISNNKNPFELFPSGQPRSSDRFAQRMVQAPQVGGSRATAALGLHTGNNPPEGENDQPTDAIGQDSPLEVFSNVINPSHDERAKIVVSGEGRVIVKIFNRLGETITDLFSGQVSGSLELYWSGVTDQGLVVPSGIYIVVAEWETGHNTAKIVVKK